MRHTRPAGAFVALVLTTVSTVVAIVGLAQPAGAVPPPRHGYVWAAQPAAAFYVASSGYEYNSAGGVIDITRTGVGAYRVRFAGMALVGGVPQVSAYGAGVSDYCGIESWGQGGLGAADEIIRVRCFSGVGAPVDARFTASITNEVPAIGRFMYAFANLPGSAAWYAAAVQYDSTGGAVLVRRTGPGSYEVDAAAVMLDVPGSAHYNGYLRATAVNIGPVHCEVLDPAFGIPPVVPVRCVDMNGVGVDTRFTISYSRKVDLLAQNPPHGTALVLPNPLGPPSIGGWSGPAAPTASQGPTGLYKVVFPGLAHPRGYAVANAFGSPSVYCAVTGWVPDLGNEVVGVQCYNTVTHLPSAAFAFNVTFTS